MTKKGREVRLAIISGICGICLVASLALFSAIPKPQDPSKNNNKAPFIATWNQPANITLPPLPTSTEFATHTKELFTISAIPKIYLTTTDPVTKNNTYQSLIMSIENSDIAEHNLKNLRGQIKPRGNSTYSIGLKYNIMPYKIKLETNANLLDMNANKKWNLLPNFIDRSYVKQFIAFQTAKLIMGDHYFQPAAKFVEVYLNNDYRGLYLLTESIEETENRLNLEVDNLATANSHIPFLLEAENKNYLCTTEYRSQIDYDFTNFRFLADHTAKIPTWLTDNDPNNNDCTFTPYDLVYPESFAKLRPDQEAHIRNTIHNIYDVIAKGLDLRHINIDLDSFVHYWIFTELFKSNTYSAPSIFIYQKPQTSDLTIGPLWDFDFTLLDSPEGFLNREPSTIYNNLFKYQSFREIITARYREFHQNLFPHLKTAIENLKENQILKTAVTRAEVKHNTWNRTLNSFNSASDPTADLPDPNILALRSYETHIDRIANYLYNGITTPESRLQTGRTDWILNNLLNW